MTSLFRGALNLIQGGDVIGAPGGQTHPLVGQDVDVGGMRLRVKALLAEGGFAVVFSAQDQKGEWFALKRQLANDREAVQAVLNEINVLKELTGHPCIIRFFQAAQLKSSSGGAEFLLLTELCFGGTLVDLLKNQHPGPSEVVKIFHSACRAVEHMHCRSKPITHRDIKIENLLFDSRGVIKLCDFGSSTHSTCCPDQTWTPLMRTQLIEEMQRNTTPCYRAPEVQDEYMDLPVGPQQDVWALGCVLFNLCYRVHPFEDAAKLRIIHAKYVIPSADQTYTMFIPLIQSCLSPDPRLRPTISDLTERVGALAAAMGVDTDQPVEGVLLSGAAAQPAQPQFNVSSASAAAGAGSSATPPPRPPPPRSDDVQQQASAMFGALKGQGMSFFKNIKDRSAAVVQTVQSTYGARGPDVSWLTSKMGVAPQPEGVPEALAAQAEDVLRNYCIEQSRPYLVVNVSQRRLKCEFPNRPIESLMPALSSGQAPTVNQLLQMCRSMFQFLRQSPNGFVMIYGGEPHCVLVAVSLILYSRLLPRPLNAFEMVSQKRSITLCLPPSFHRVIDLVSKIVNSTPEQIRKLTHNRAVELQTLTMEPIPLVNRLRTGCRPFAEIYSAGNKLWNTCKDYEQLKSFEMPEHDSADLNLGSVPVGDDVTIVVYHARWSKMQNKMQQVVMFSAGFHANFWDPHQSVMTLHRGDLDLNPEEERYFQENFRIVLGLKIGSSDRGFSNGVAEPPAFLGYEGGSVSPRHLVDSAEEYDTIKTNFEIGAAPMATSNSSSSGSTIAATAPKRPEPPKPAPAPVVPTTDFFSSLEWGSQAPAAASSSSAASADLFSVAAPSSTSVSDSHHRSDHSASPVVSRPQKTMDAEDYERMYGIRVGGDVQEDDDADKYRFDCDKKPGLEHETPILGGPSPVQSTTRVTDEFDLLGLGGSSSTTSAPAAPTAPVSSDPFGDLLGGYSTPAGTGSSSVAPPSSNSVGAADDLFGDWTSSGTASLSAQSMQRNVSAPSLPQQNGSSTAPATFDPFAEFLSGSIPQLSGSNPGSKQGSATNSGSTTPMPSRPNYNRSAFDSINPAAAAGVKPKVTADAFGDLLSSQGFTSSIKNANRTMGDMRRADEIRDLDPVQIKIRDWTAGKEKNIRALLGSLNDVLWEGADKWQQPNMGELLSAAQIKKWYRKACLVVHPDKQTGTPQEELAKAVFTQLNEAWTAFEQAGSPSL